MQLKTGRIRRRRHRVLISLLTAGTVALATGSAIAQEGSATEGQAKSVTCGACHGADGKGMAALGAPNLTNDIWLYGGHPSDIEYTLLNGRNGNMPAFEETLSEDRRRILAAYVQSLSGS